MAQEFTPGPWAVAKKASRRVTANGIIICNAVLRNRGGPKHKTYMKDEHEAEANAALLAASPDMFAALVEAEARLRYSGDHFHDAGLISRAKADWASADMCRAAIAKALGHDHPR